MTTAKSVVISASVNEADVNCTLVCTCLFGVTIVNKTFEVKDLPAFNDRLVTATYSVEYNGQLLNITFEVTLRKTRHWLVTDMRIVGASYDLDEIQIEEFNNAWIQRRWKVGQDLYYELNELTKVMLKEVIKLIADNKLDEAVYSEARPNGKFLMNPQEHSWRIIYRSLTTGRICLWADVTMNEDGDTLPVCIAIGGQTSNKKYEYHKKSGRWIEEITIYNKHLYD